MILMSSLFIAWSRHKHSFSQLWQIMWICESHYPSCRITILLIDTTRTLVSEFIKKMQQQTDMFVNREMVTYSSSYAVPNFRILCNLMVHWDGLNYDYLTAVNILIPGS